MSYSPALRPLLSILVLLVLGYLAPAAGSTSAAFWRVNVDEACTYKLLPRDGVMLTTKLTFRNAKGGRLTDVRVIAGWNSGRLYPKAETTVLVRLEPGQTARRTITRTIPSAPTLWRTLKASGMKCKSTYSYTLP